jgi:flagellar biosynthesis protein FlhF
MNGPIPQPPSQQPRLPFATAAYQAPPRPETSKRTDEVAALRGEVRSELRALRSELGARAPALGSLAAEVEALRALVESLVPAPRPTRHETALCNEVGLEGAVARRLLARLRRVAAAGADLREAWREVLAESFRVAPWPLGRHERALVAMVGPCGVGKTTTSAKLAATAIANGRTVLMVACDAHRVGAAHQLRRYAQLMGADFAVAQTGAELARCVEGARADVLLVDTAGRGASGEDTVERWLGSSTLTGIERHVLLTVPAALREADARHIATAFSLMKPTALCITKLDDTSTPAGIIHAAVATRLPISVLTNGPRVPEDVAPATRTALLEALVPHTGRRTR